MNYKIFFIGIVGALMISFLLPVFISARADNNGSGQSASNFCSQLEIISSNIDQKFTNRDAKLKTKWTEINNKILERRNERDAKLTEKRAKWDANREEHFTKLEEKAQTDEQKQAVLDFVQTIEQAVAVRRAAVDQAIQDFRDGVEDLKLSRRASIDEVTETYRETVRTAFQQGLSDCQNSVNAATVRANLRIKLKAARENFTTNRQNVEKTGDSMEALIDAKKEAIEKAIDDFKAVLEEAREELKKAFE